MKKIIFSLICLWSIAILLCSCKGKSYLETSTESESFVDEDSEEVSDLSKTGYVQILGQVNHPGVYEIEQDTRLFEVIEKAGGLTSEAAENSINQAETVADGQSIYIISKDELLEEEANSSEADKEDGKVNINTASAESLMTLPGIGESKASQIIEYRQNNGSFTSIEGIMNIQGIKEGVFNKIKDKITVG